MSIKYQVLCIMGFLVLSLSILTTNPLIQIASAHLAGQPLYLKINNQFALLYPVPTTSLSDFNLPQDLAPQNYLVNQDLQFVIETDRLPAPPEVVAKTHFDWDFGDGAKTQGMSTNHTYTKIGSYIATIYANDGTTPTPQLIESILINILPDQNYVLPKAVIKVSGRTSSDPLTDILQADFTKEVNFDGSISSGQIVSYSWDFGDGKAGSGAQSSHTYEQKQNQVFPVLRIKDSNGFIADGYVEVQNQLVTGQSALKPANQPQSPKPKTGNQLIYSLLGISGFLGILFIIFRKIKH